MSQKNLEIMIRLKLIINFWRSFKMILINCKISFDLNWSETCITLITATNANLTEKSGTLKIKKILIFFKLYIKMEKTIIKSDDIKIPKQKFHQHKRIVNVNIDQIVVPINLNFFIGYKDTKKNRLLSIFLPKMNAYRKGFDESKFVSFLIKDDKLLEK